MNYLENELLSPSTIFLFTRDSLYVVKIELSGQQTKVTDYVLLKNHIKSNNYESAFKLLLLLRDYDQWLKAFFLTINKLTQNGENVLFLKRTTLRKLIIGMNNKDFGDDSKNAHFRSIKILALSNMFYRCLASKHYECAFLIADTINNVPLFKILISHAKHNKFLSIAYLAASKIEALVEDGDDSVMSQINKLASNNGFNFSQNNLHNIIKDIDNLMSQNEVEGDYVVDHNPMEIDIECELLIRL